MLLKNERCVFIITVMFSLFFFSCKKKNSTDAIVPKKVDAIHIKMETLNEKLKNIGTLNYKSRHSVSSLVSGRLEKIYVKEGDPVFKGQILGELRNIQLENQKEVYENNLSEAESSLLIAEDNLRNSKMNLEKQIKSLEKLRIQIEQSKLELAYKEKCHLDSLELLKIGGVSEQRLKEEEMNLSQLKTSIELMEKELEISSVGFRDFDIELLGFKVPDDKTEREKLLVEINACQAINLVNTEKVRLDNAKKNLANIENLMEELKIKSSVDGIIGSCNFQNGDHIGENETCFVVFDASILLAVFYVQEQEIFNFDVGCKIDIEIPSIKKSYATMISEISPVADPVSGNFCVKTEIKNQKNELKPGMFITSTLNLKDHEDYMVIPESCIVYQKNSDPKVFCISNEHVFYKNIKLHCKKNGMAYVKHGLEINDVIVDRPSILLNEGDAVEVL